MMGMLPKESGVFLKICFWFGFGYIFWCILYFVIGLL